MAAPNLDEINTIATKHIMPGLTDNYFKNDPLLEYLRRDRLARYEGGPKMQENFIYKPMKGGSYQKGDQFDITKRQTKTGLLFEPKFYEVNVTEYMEDVEVLARGPRAVFSLVQADLGNAALTMSAILAVALYHHGQNLAGDDRSAEINGLEEALNDGVNNSWAGNAFASYGEQARVDVSPALNTPVGLQAANVNGQLTFRALEQSYQSCVIGNERPVLGVTDNRVMGFLNEQYSPQQRFQIDTTEPVIGWPGIKWKNATIMSSQYVPGPDGVNDPDIGNYNNATSTFWWLNPGKPGVNAYVRLHVATSPKYSFGFTGFKPAQDDTTVAGQILVSLNLTVRAPRLMRVLHGITG